MDLLTGGGYDCVVEEIRVDALVCEQCEIHLKPYNESIYICTGCGKIEQKMFSENCYNSEFGKSFNVNPHNHNPVYVKGVSKLSTEQYNISKSIPTTSVIEKAMGVHSNITNWNKKITAAGYEFQIPAEVIDSVSETYKNLYQTKSISLRGARVTALLVVLVYFEGIKHNVFINKSILGDIVGVKSNGDITRTIRLVYSLDYEVPPDEDITRVQIHQYFTDLGIDTKYIDFMNRMLEASSQRKVHHRNNSSRETTRYAAILYIIANNTKKIHHAKISKVCDVASTTFKNHVAMLSQCSEHPDIAKLLLEYKFTI